MRKPPAQAVVIINNRSRQGASLAHSIKTEFAEQNFAIVRTYFINKPNKFTQALRTELKKGANPIIVGGGDGTLAAAANVLAHTNVTLGILPLGTTNNFARSLEIPLDIPGAIAVIARGKARKVNLGTANGHYYANIAAIGLSVTVARQVSDDFKRYFGRLAYYATGLRWFFTHRAFSCHVEADNNDYRFKTHQLIVANGRYHSALPLTPHASIKKNSLLVMAFGTTPSRWQHLKTLVAFAHGTYYRANNAFVINAGHVKVETRPRRRVETDGEVIAKTPVEFSVAHDALKVFRP